MRENILKTKSFDFAIRIVKLCQILETEKRKNTQQTINKSRYSYRGLNQ